MALHSERSGPTEGDRLILVHGFGQTGRCWGQIATDLARDHEVTALDAPGHGGSADVRADLDQTGALITATGGRGVYIGYSMGARMVLHAAMAAPDLITRLVLIGGTPGIEDGEERAARHERDRATATRIRAEGVDAFFATWFDQPLFAGLPPEARFLHERRRNSPEGLAASLEYAGTGSQMPLWSRLASLTMPVLVVAGEHDRRYADIGRRMVDAIGANATFQLVPGAGHAAHLERPRAFLTTLRTWLGR